MRSRYEFCLCLLSRPISILTSVRQRLLVLWESIGTLLGIIIVGVSTVGLYKHGWMTINSLCYRDTDLRCRHFSTNVENK